MFVASKKGSVKILHNQQCFYGKRIRPEDRQLFYTVEEGEKAGYHSCKYCSAIGRHYRKEATKIKQFCEENKIFLQHESREIHVQTPISHWKIVWNEKKGRIFLYHKNVFRRFMEEKEEVPGYHRQPVTKSSIYGYLKYIVIHDKWIFHHGNGEENKPKESYHGIRRKKYISQVRRMKKKERRSSIRRVYNLLEQLENYRKMKGEKIK
jgi:hypothetical protein